MEKKANQETEEKEAEKSKLNLDFLKYTDEQSDNQNPDEMGFLAKKQYKLELEKQKEEMKKLKKEEEKKLLDKAM